MKRLASLSLTSLVALAMVVAACADTNADVTTTASTTSTSSGSTTTMQPTTTIGSTTTSSMSTTTTTNDEPIDPVGEPRTDTLVTEGFPGIGETAFLVDVRLGKHEGFERVVLEFDEAAPEYRIEYLTGPILESPSGNEIDIAGDSYLSVTMSPATAFDLSGDAPEDTYEGPDRLVSDATLAIEEIVRTEDFENVMTWVIGMDDTLPFGVAVLEGPYRLVIDVRTG